MHARLNACVHQDPRTSISTHAYLLGRQASEEEKEVLGQELAAAQAMLVTSQEELLQARAQAEAAEVATTAGARTAATRQAELLDLQRMYEQVQQEAAAAAAAGVARRSGCSAAT